MVLNHWSRRCDLVGRISGTSFFIVILVIIKSSPETIKQIRYLLNYEVSNKEGKTIVCGHWHCSYGHSEYEGIGSEFGPDADFSPYYAPGIIALDACTAHSGRVNVVVLED